MAEIIWTEPALQSLDEIADYISLENIAAAQQVVQKVFDRVDQLSANPLSGREIPELETSIFREVIISPCRVFYRVDKEQLFIVDVMREEQHFRNPFF
ncbi:MAG: type II toxin-antitoxin system RelE/ParE family toxin [Balneolales bacterium]|nr:type II toxin-antitoxin system RelE/ParE family toxin [Balneolales bacterium]